MVIYFVSLYNNNNTTMADIRQDQQFFFKGADRQTNIELSSLEQGSYFDASNMRQSSVLGNEASLEKIKGEELFASVENDSRLSTNIGYECIGACEVIGYKIAFWAHNSENPFIQINDMVVACSENLTLNKSFPLQIAINESCIGGEIYVSDFNSPTLIFNIQDLVDNVGGEKYFSEFNIELYTINLGKPIDCPVFDSIENVGFTNGLEHGEYSYSFAYVDSTGNKTQFSQSTPLIPIVNRISTSSNVYKGSMTNGGLTGSKSQYGIKIKFRITNLSNYSYILVKRVRWVAGTSLGYTPTSESYQIPRALLNGEISIAEFIDSSLIEWTPLSDEQDSFVMSAIKCNKAVRYFNNRLELANIVYESKDINNSINFNASSNGNTIFPIIDKIGTLGYNDIYNQVYRKQYFHGDRYGFGFVGYDANGETSFVTQITGSCTNYYGGADAVTSNANSYIFPNRREALNQDSLLHSVTRWKGSPFLPDILNADRYTHDLFYNNTDVSQYDTTSNISIQNGNYHPLTPTDIDDSSTSGHYYRINTGVFTEPFNQSSESLEYDVNNLTPDIYAMGIAVNGISDIPYWMKAFSITRTKRANRVVAQGIAIWDLTPPSNLRSKMNLAQYCTNHKSRTRIRFYSDDIDKLGITINSDLKLQLVAPVGFSTQMYHADYKSAAIGINNTINRNIDLISHANIVNSNIDRPSTIGLYDADGNSVYNTKFGKWRNTASYINTIFGGDSANVKKFDIESINNVTDGRTSYYEIELSQPLYVKDTVTCMDGTVTADSNDTDVCNFHEPFYIVNIIDDNAEIPDNNTNQYINTGHYQKVESVIGKVTNGVYFEFDLVDERFDDCIPNKYDPNVANVNTFIYIEDDITKEKKAWLNIQYKNSSTINTILNSLESAGDDGIMVGSVRVFGVYFNSWSSNDRNFSIIFKQDNQYSSFDVKYFIPQTNSLVLVRYDNRFPIKVFGGDSIIGDTLFCAADGTCTNNGDVITQTDVFFPLPHKGFELNSNYDIMKNPNSIFDPIQNNRNIRLDTVRQWVIRFTSEMIVNSPLYVKLTGDGTTCDDSIYQEYQMFPSTNYVMRPNDWDTTCKNNFESDGGKISNQYISDYPNEISVWQYGGFKFNGKSNIDYSQYKSDKFFISKPKVGFEERTHFCSRIIWSNERVPNVQDSPNIKTFPSLNVYDISDRNGAIKYLFDGETSKGENLYAITDSGVCLLFTNKTLLSDLGGNSLGYISATEGFIKGQYWLSNEIGMNDEWWRSAAETSNSLIFGNYDSIYVLGDNKIADIGRNKYYPKLYSDLFSVVGNGYSTKITSAIDNKHEQYWIGIGLSRYLYSMDKNLSVLIHSRKTPPVVGIDNLYAGVNSIVEITSPDWLVPSCYAYLSSDFQDGEVIYINNNTDNMDLLVYRQIPTTDLIATIPSGETWMFIKDSNSITTWSVTPNMNGSKLFVYSLSNGRWVGTYDYQYEKFITEGNTVYGVRNLDINELDKGWIINNEIVNGSVTCVSSPIQMYGKEWRDIRINSLNKPTRVEFANSYNLLPECELSPVMNGNPNPYYLKNYNGFTNKIPRKFLTDSQRLQGRYMVYRISHNLPEEFVVIDVINDFVLLRLQ